MTRIDARLLVGLRGPDLVATTDYTYDDFGRRVSETDPAGSTRMFDYDAADNLVQVTYPTGWPGSSGGISSTSSWRGPGRPRPRSTG